VCVCVCVYVCVWFLPASSLSLLVCGLGEYYLTLSLSLSLFFSLSSLGVLCFAFFALKVVTHTWKTPNKEHRIGQCSRYLESLKPGDVVVGALRPSVLVPPEDATKPVVMVGLGTGLAPFVAFLQHGLQSRLLGEQVGPRYLAFGARSWQEYSSAAEITAYNHGAQPLLTHLRLAFSRDSAAKVYVQHKLAEDAEIIADMLLRQCGSFYLCGGVQPVPAIKAALLAAFEEYGGMSAHEAAIMLEKMKTEERYVLEVY
jgi:sulfite reductase (NADPH) flavoprotein alpha-component